MEHAYYVTGRTALPQNSVVFMNSSGKKLYRVFASPFLANRFAMKIAHSKKCTLVSYPLNR